MGYRKIVACSALCKEGFVTYNSIHSSRHSTENTTGLQLSLHDTEKNLPNLVQEVFGLQEPQPMDSNMNS